MKRTILAANLQSGTSVSVKAGPEIKELSRPVNSASNRFYTGNRRPLQNSHFTKLPVNSINPGEYVRKIREKKHSVILLMKMSV